MQTGRVSSVRPHRSQPHHLSTADRLTLVGSAFCLSQLVIVVVVSALHMAHLL